MGLLDYSSSVAVIGAATRFGMVSVTPLMLAAERGQLEILQVLLDAGVNVNEATTDHGYTALVFACNNADAVKVLLNAGADANAKNHSGVTVLMYAAMDGDLGAVKALLDAGADVNTVAGSSMTALGRAYSTGHSDIADLLIRAGATEW